jgi:hypothetical protein
MVCGSYGESSAPSDSTLKILGAIAPKTRTIAILKERHRLRVLRPHPEWQLGFGARSCRHATARRNEPGGACCGHEFSPVHLLISLIPTNLSAAVQVLIVLSK